MSDEPLSTVSGLPVAGVHDGCDDGVKLSPSEAYLVEALREYAKPDVAAGYDSVLATGNFECANRADLPSPDCRVHWLDIEGTSNVRDIGGWTGLKTGLAFRGAEGDGVHGIHVTEKGLESFHALTHARTDLDLRRSYECEVPDRSVFGIRYMRISIEAYDGLFSGADAYAAALRVFADADNFPVYFHCWGGADRTGMLALLLEAICGAPEPVLFADYELTTFCGSRRYRGEYLMPVVDRLRSMPGKTLNEKIEWFVRSAYGLSDDEIGAIRANLTGAADGVGQA